MCQDNLRDLYQIYVKTTLETSVRYISRFSRSIERCRDNLKRNISHAFPQIIFLPSIRIEPSQSKSANYSRSEALLKIASSKNQRDILSRLLSLGHIDQKPKGFRGISRFIARYAPIRPYKPNILSSKIRNIISFINDRIIKILYILLDIII